MKYHPIHQDCSQCASAVLMVEPKGFGFNTETASDNHFNSEPKLANVEQLALKEFNRLRTALIDHGVEVCSFQAADGRKAPDAVFPNNWFSTHAGGLLCLYPMMASNRRLERNETIIKALDSRYPKCWDLSPYELGGRFLESTGSMVLDRKERTAYCCISERSDPLLANEWCLAMDYQLLTFDAHDSGAKTIYHTNVMMAIGSNFAVVCLDAIRNDKQRSLVKAKLSSSAKEIVEIDLSQLSSFCGNLIQLQTTENESLVVLSTRAWNAFNPQQKEILSSRGKVIHEDLATIETVGGGGARCMLAELF